jgi:ABC-type ATPase involved in cell division
MTMKFILGQNEADKNISIDIPTLLRSRMLVQANSGGGKSRTLRRIVNEKEPELIKQAVGKLATFRFWKRVKFAVLILWCER